MEGIHPTAIIGPNVKLGRNVRIGAYTIITGDCEVGDDCWIDANVKIGRWTYIGSGTRIYFGALVGDDPQDHRFKEGVRARTEIGSNVTIREYVTIHRSPFEGGVTSIGDGTLLMAFVHVGHDARIGRNVTAANHTSFSGHVIVEDGAVLSAHILVHQFCRIGAIAMVGARVIIRQDIPPFCMLSESERVVGPNVIGLRRNGFDSDRRLAVRKAIKSFFFRGLNTTQALEEICREFPESEDIAHFTDFIRKTERGIMPGDEDIARLAKHNINDDDPEVN